MALVHSLWWLTANLAARRPVLVLLDDAHWAHAASLSFLAYLLPGLESVSVAVILSIRTGEPGPPVLGDLMDPPATVLNPANLSEQAAGGLAALRLPRKADQSFVRALHAATRGNPLLLNELLRTVAERSIEPDDDGARRLSRLESPSVSRAEVKRVRRLGSEATDAARCCIRDHEPDDGKYREHDLGQPNREKLQRSLHSLKVPVGTRQLLPRSAPFHVGK